MGREIKSLGPTGVQRLNPRTDLLEDEYEFLIVKRDGNSTQKFFTPFEISEEQRKQHLIGRWKKAELAARRVMGAGNSIIQNLIDDRRTVLRRLSELATMDEFINDPEG